jgi:prophage regulatory protein
MKIIRMSPVSDRVGYHPVHIRRLIKQGKFPAPVQLGPRSVGWIDDEIDEWIKQKIEERNSSSNDPKHKVPDE